MLSINTNLSSKIVQSNLKQSTNTLNTAIERMTTGAKINHAKDNAANYSINTQLSTKISAYQVAEDNCAMGLDLVQTASSSLATMSDLTSRLRSLATQAQNGTYGSRSIDAINSEAQAIVQELNRVRSTTTYNGINLLSNAANVDDTNAISTQAVTLPQAATSGFIEEVKRRDTSTMTTLASVDESTSLTNGTYSISTAEELAKLATMTNNGKIGENTEFVLANDIDLSGYSTGEGWMPIGNFFNRFKASFDGNGYVVSNLYINRPDKSYLGLFGGATSSATFKNVGIVDCDVTGYETVSGLVGSGNFATITNSYATGSVTGYIDVGGLIAYGDSATITNSYATSSVTGHNNVGGLMGDGSSATLVYAYYTDTTGQTVGIGGGSTKSGTAQLVTMSELDELIAQGVLPKYQGYVYKNSFTLQVGINSSDSSQIELNLAGIDISALDGLDMSDVSALSTIDEVLAAINEQQTNLGAVENRLMSALDQISVSYDNLVSTRSTIRDADIAEESSVMIRNQILQQAAATLMATANQSPSIALQLL